MTPVKRERCVITGESDLQQLYSFRDFPMFMGATLQKQADDVKADMTFCISKGSGMIQLRELIPQQELYAQSHNSSIGEIWARHFQALAAFIEQFSPSDVFEIGGGVGRLAAAYHQKHPRTPWTILEPSPVRPLEGCQASYIKGFWEGYQPPAGFCMDTLVHSHVLEHVYDPAAFVAKCADALPEGRWMVFSVPHMEECLRRKYTNALNFEHTYFLTEPYIEWLMAKNHFEIIERQLFRADHSLFFAARKNSAVQEKPLQAGLYEKNKKLFMEYVAYYQDLIRELNGKLRASDKAVYLFGAHIFSQYLIEFGLDTARIKAVLDNDAFKQGKRLYGTSLQAVSPQVLRDEEKPAVILKVGNYAQEIKEDILCHINAGTEFWE